MMITGAHAIIYSKNADADREFFQKIIKLTHVDVGGGWLIFGLPPSEIAVHPADNSSHALYLMCDDFQDFIDKMNKQGIKCSAIQNQGWGLLTELKLPGGGKLGVYEPRHARPKPMTVKKKAKATAAKKVMPVKKKKATKKN
jgi:hypothetical protein